MGAFFFGKAIKNSGIKILWKKGLSIYERRFK